MTKEKIDLVGGSVFLKSDKDNGTDTSFTLINSEKDESFGLRINIKNRNTDFNNSRLKPTIDYLINILKTTKRLGLLIDYQPSFKYFTSIDDVQIYEEISFYFFFEK